MRFDRLYDLLSLNAVAILEKALKDTAAIVLKDQLLVFGADQFKAFIDYRVLLLIGDLHLSLLDQKFVVVYL
jgi:hypothetical protein